MLPGLEPEGKKRCQAVQAMTRQLYGHTLAFQVYFRSGDLRISGVGPLIGPPDS